MPIKFKNPQPIDQAAVHALEEQLGFGLTDDYTVFLSTVSNGGSIDPVVFADDLDIGVVGFLGIGTEH